MPTGLLRSGVRYRIRLEDYLTPGGAVTWTGTESMLDLDALAEAEPKERR